MVPLKVWTLKTNENGCMEESKTWSFHRSAGCSEHVVYTQSQRLFRVLECSFT